MPRSDQLCVVSAFEQRGVSSAVQDVMQNQNDGHADAEPFVQDFAAHLILRHAQKKDGHTRVRNHLDDFCFVRVMPSSVRSVQPVDPVFKIAR